MILPGGVSYAEVGGASAVSTVCVVEVDGTSNQSDAWLLLWEDGVSIYPVNRHSWEALKIELSRLSHYGNRLFVILYLKLHLRNAFDSFASGLH